MLAGTVTKSPASTVNKPMNELMKIMVKITANVLEKILPNDFAAIFILAKKPLNGFLPVSIA